MSSTEHSEYDKETLTAKEDRGGQEGQVGAGKDDELNADKTEERAHRRSSLASRRSNVLANAAPDVDMEKGGSGMTTATEAEPQDPNIVSWDGPDDPANPLNWSTSLKVVNVGLVSGICLVTPLASSMFAPGVPNLMAEFQSSNIELGTLVVSIYVLGFAAGPMILAPLSELYGRMPIYHVCNIMFVIFNVACAVASNLNMLIGFRLLAGIFGSAPLTNGGGTIADLVKQEHRGAAMATFVIGPLLGPVIGPIAGGYLTEAKGWRWVFWVLALVSGFFTLLAFIFMRETYAVTLLERKAAKLRSETNNPHLRSKLDAGLTPRDLFWRSIVRPTKMLLFSPIVLSMSLYVGIIYGYLYLLFTTFTSVFEGQYHFSPGSVGLTYLGLGIGSLVGLALVGLLSDRILKAKTKPNPDGSPGEMKPEYRLPPMVYAAGLIPAGLFVYGWTAAYRVQFVVPIFGTCLIGIGNLAVFMCVSTYLIDAFPLYAASVMAANTLIRSAMGAVLPLAGPSMYQSLGLGWGNSLLGFIALACIPVPWVLNRYGEGIRKRFDISDRL